MQPKTSRRTFLRATAVLAVGKLLQIWRPQATALAQTIKQSRPEKPAQKQELAWSNELTLSASRSAGEEQVMIKLVVTNMATNEQSQLVLDMRERYLVELSVT